jgi:hypothetical protein
MKQYGSRMELISVRDLSKESALRALQVLRDKTSYGSPEDAELFHQVYDLVGGRLAFLTKVAKSKDMIAKCHDICENEKTWFLVCECNGTVGLIDGLTLIRTNAGS